MRHAYEAGAEHVLILNNDLILDEHCVEEMAAHTAADVGFVTGAVYYLDDPQRIWTLSGEISRVTLERVVDGREQIRRGTVSEGWQSATLRQEARRSCRDASMK